jgi:hypothetical protein
MINKPTITDQLKLNDAEFLFVDYFLEKRLKRVPTEMLRNFLLKYKDFPKSTTQDKVVEQIVSYYSIMKTNDVFMCAFKEFLRDYVLCARESNYLIRVINTETVIYWIQSWQDKEFIGQNYKFYLHVYGSLDERFIEVNEEKAYFPSEVILLVAKIKEPKTIADGLNILEYSPTSEIELIFRKESNLIEVRGQYQIIRDFIVTCGFDQQNPLRTSNSIFIGDSDSVPANTITTLGRRIGINALKEALNGKYLTVASPVSGSRTARMKASSNGKDDLSDETNPAIKAVLDEILANPEKCSILFEYKNKKYSFGITKSGGLTFFKYTPEEVITYILQKIKNL